MGNTAGVGSLVLVKSVKNYEIQDIITFKQNKKFYTHRIIEQKSDGFVTKGDLNGAPDPWIVKEENIVGRAEKILPFVGWIWLMIPWILLGWIVAYLISKTIKKYYWRWYFRIFASSLVLALVVLWFRPWLNFSLINFYAEGENLARFNVVNTGIFPIRANDQIFYNGDLASVLVEKKPQDKLFFLYPQIALSNWWILLAILICLSPLLISYFVYLSQPKDKFLTANLDPKNRASRILSHFFIISISYFVVCVILSLSFTNAGVTASIKNNNNTAGTTVWNCEGAIKKSLAKSGGYFAWDLGKADAPENYANNHYNGVFAGTPSLSSEVGCLQDQAKKSLVFNNLCVNPIDNVQPINNPVNFSLEVWFSTKSTGNGHFIGFHNHKTITAYSKNDRHLYLDNFGNVVFGVYSPKKQVQIVSSISQNRNYADGAWHHAVATFANSTMSLFVDGILVSSQANAEAEDIDGFWRVGCGAYARWKNGDNSRFDGPSFYTGKMQFIAAYDRALSAEEILTHYQARK